MDLILADGGHDIDAGTQGIRRADLAGAAAK